MSLVPGTAESSVVCPFFSYEIKNWCCQKMIVTICLTGDVFLNFTNRLCFEWPLPRQHMMVEITNFVFVIFFFFFLASVGGQIPFSKEGILV